METRVGLPAVVPVGNRRYSSLGKLRYAEKKNRARRVLSICSTWSVRLNILLAASRGTLSWAPGQSRWRQAFLVTRTLRGPAS
jgi:hypothetical protein